MNKTILNSLLITPAIFAACNKQDEPEKPNIIYILADDLGYGDLSCYGQEKFQTPNIDKLAELGMKFTQHYSGSTVSAPSRSSLMTGQHTGHTFIRGNAEVLPEGQEPMDSSILTIAELLQNAGYFTGAFGKWGLGYPGSEGDPNMQGFDEFYGYNCQRIGHHYYPTHMWHNQKIDSLEGNEGIGRAIYGPDIIHKYAMKFLEENKDKPFFMYYPSIIPHAELLAPENYMNKYRGKYLPEKSYKGCDSPDSCNRFKNGAYGSQPEAHAAFAAMINVLDDQVGEIMSKLEELGIAENTLIIFTSDNGPHQEGGADPDYFNSNGPVRGYKRDLYDGGVRVPFIAVWKNKIIPGSVSDHTSAFWDFLPTACDIAGINTPQNIDGISYLPTLLGKDQPEHKYLYWEFLEKGGRQAVRLGKWKGVRYNMTNNPDAPIELYDISSDIGETNNLASEYPEVIKEIAKIMEQEHTLSKKESFRFEYEK